MCLIPKHIYSHFESITPKHPPPLFYVPWIFNKWTRNSFLIPLLQKIYKILYSNKYQAKVNQSKHKITTTLSQIWKWGQWQNQGGKNPESEVRLLVHKYLIKRHTRGIIRGHPHSLKSFNQKDQSTNTNTALAKYQYIWFKIIRLWITLRGG